MLLMSFLAFIVVSLLNLVDKYLAEAGPVGDNRTKVGIIIQLYRVLVGTVDVTNENPLTAKLSQR